MPNNFSKLTLVLGGARSGKSHFAETLVKQSGLEQLYLATSQAYDSEMQARISKHKHDRGEGWTTIEEPLELSAVLKSECRPDRVMLVDCLTLWVTNLMMADRNLEKEFETLIETLHGLNGAAVFVSNEVGQGIVPDNAMARAFRDHAGRLHQMIAAEAKTVYFVTAGLSQKLK